MAKFSERELCRLPDSPVPQALPALQALRALPAAAPPPPSSTTVSPLSRSGSRTGHRILKHTQHLDKARSAFSIEYRLGGTQELESSVQY